MDDFDFTGHEIAAETSTPIDELRTIARNLVANTIKSVDWADFKQMAEFVTTDEIDADIVVRLMANAEITVKT